MQVLHNSELDTMNTDLTIGDICPSLSLKRLKELRNTSENNFQATLGAVAIEELVDVDLNVVNSMGAGMRGMNQGATLGKAKIQKALCQVFMESYGLEKDKTMNIVSLILLDQLAMKQYLIQ